MSVEIFDTGVRQQRPGMLSRGLIRGSHADHLIALFEFIRGAEKLAIQDWIEGATHAIDIEEQIFSSDNFRN